MAATHERSFALVVRRKRGALRSVGKSIQEMKRRLTPTEIGLLSAAHRPHRHFPDVGGFLFYFFMVTMTKLPYHKALLDFDRRYPGESLPDDIAQAMLDVFLFDFAVWVTTEVYRTSQKSNIQLFYWTLYNCRYGTSGTALSLQSRTTKLLMTSSTFRDKLRRLLTARSTILDNKLLTTECLVVHWIDNYAKTHIRNCASVGKEIYYQTNWTAWAVKFGPERVSALYKRAADGTVIPAMPSEHDLFNTDRCRLLIQSLVDVEFNQFGVSVVTTQDIKNWPLKYIPEAREGIDPADVLLSSYTETSTEGVRYLKPKAILPNSPNTKEGLLSTLVDIKGADPFGATDPPAGGKYTAVCSDILFFYSIIRLFYSFDGFAPIRRDMFWTLGLWHPYHHMYVTIWRNYFSQWLGEVFHLLWPGTHVRQKHRGRHIGAICIWLRQITPDILPPMRRTLADLLLKPMVPKNKTYIRALKNLEALLVFIIPVVHALTLRRAL